MNNQQQEMILKTINWVKNADREIKAAGGNGVLYLLELMPVQLLEHLIHNDIYFSYQPTKSKDENWIKAI